MLAVLAWDGLSLLLGAGEEPLGERGRKDVLIDKILQEACGCFAFQPCSPVAVQVTQRAGVGFVGSLLVSCKVLAAPSGSSIPCCKRAVWGACRDQQVMGIVCDQMRATVYPVTSCSSGVGGEIDSRKYPS